MYEPSLNDKKVDRDWHLLLATMGLILIGAAFIFSASAAGGGTPEPWYKQIWTRQIFYYTVGVAIAIVVCSIDYVSLARWSTVIYWINILLLLAVLIVGTKHYGARRWIELKVVNLQPSEFAKIGYILMQANFLSRPAEELARREVFWTALGLVALPFALIVSEPDLGSSIVLLPVSLVTMYVAGVPKSFLAKLAGGGIVLGILLVVAVVFAPPQYVRFVPSYMRDRVVTYFGRSALPKEATPQERKAHEKAMRDKSYNVEQALISVGSGGLTGKGWRQGTQYSLGFLPQAGAHNDFIFSVIAEEEGFIGSVAILTLYTVLLFSGIKIASQARDRLGKLLAVGVVTLLFSHVFINIGMNIRLMPVTGIPLPLLSYGGSSVVCSLIAIGILHNVHVYRRFY